MHIEFVEVANFRKLHCTRVSLAADKTVFVGANNSGKTSAMVALRYFLLKREQSRFSVNDFTLSHWHVIDKLGQSWESAKEKDEALPEVNLDHVMPLLDVWLHAELSELQYVKDLLPSLDWEGGRLGIRLRFEPKDPRQLQNDYLTARAEAKAIQDGGTVKIWPESLTKFLERRLNTSFEVKAYKLDPTKCVDPKQNFASPQSLEAAVALEFDPFRGLILIHEISAQRGFGQSGPLDALDDDDARLGPASATRKLSEQLRQYYSRHINPTSKPDAQDLEALKAIEEAQRAFDIRLRDGFSSAIGEMETLGYPGITDPQISISTRLRPIDGLNHESALQYVFRGGIGESAYEVRLPEDSNGLGYQNLISMVFRLMSFRDAWMRVGKAQTSASSLDLATVAPLHLVLIEEPEAHLHTQVQQVFIRQAYRILRNNPALGDSTTFRTQLVVSTHSSHVAHECEYESLRYFRRMPAKDGDIPTSRVANLSNVFGSDSDTKRFVTRYLKVTHCDLLFADAAVMIEGPAERILVPHFVRHQSEFASLNEAYITWLEISGSHAHRLRNLVQTLGLTTLIITDLDAIGADGKSAQPQKGVGQKTRNATLKGWCPALATLDDLLAAKDDAKIKSYTDEQFSIRAAYQCPVEIAFKGKQVEALAYTLEDALCYANLALFEKHEGKGLLKKFKEAIEASADIAALSASILKELKDGSKAEMALGLLELEDPKQLQPPPYIKEGLTWLMSEVKQNQKSLGLPIAGDIQ